ncbi:ACT domain-containing protein [bacterium]|nr:ACT domain-containing protein [bacterium]
MYNEIRVFVENKSGKLAKVAGALGNAGIDIINIELADEGQFGVFKLLTADPQKAKQALENAGMTVAFNKVAVIEIADQPGSLVKLAKALENEGMSVQDAYGCILDRGKRAIFVVKGDNLEAIESAAKGAGLKVLDSLE